jgi:hypothetical protein
MAILAAALALPLLGSCGSRAPSDPLQAQAWEHGIEILGVQLMADGDFARLNYKVVDYEKAKRALRGEVRLLPEGSERPLPVTSTGRLGPLRQRPSATGRQQFMLFTNQGRRSRRGTLPSCKSVSRIGSPAFRSPERLSEPC